VISLDREERGSGRLSAAAEVTQAHGVPVASIVGLGHLLEYLRERGDRAEALAAIEAYRAAHGA
jgi:orotate phosphoribosyltransferase